MASNLHKQVKDFLDGKINVNHIKKDIEDTYNSRAYNARRLVETEVNRCEDVAFIRFCKETGVIKVRRNEVLDRRTCSECAALDGKVYPLDEAPGVVHPLCRGFNSIEDNDRYSDYNTKYNNKIRIMSPDKGDGHDYSYKESNINWNKELNISEKNSDALNDIHKQLNSLRLIIEKKKYLFLI